MKKALLLFVDGIGMGEEDWEKNPLFYTPTPQLSSLLGGKSLVSKSAGYHGEQASLGELDANLGVPGEPQSATGQAALFTGENAPQLLGYHLNGFPIDQLRELLRTSNVFSRLLQQGKEVTFINAYRTEFFQHHLPYGLPHGYSCSTLITYYAGVPFRSLEDLSQGNAVYMDITNQLLQQMGYRVETVTPREAAQRLVRLSRHYNLALFEYFLTDIVGHKKDQERAGEVVFQLDQFVGEIVKNIDFRDTLLLLTSDHGNLEDLYHSLHTRNPVPLFLAGNSQGREIFLQRASSLVDVTPLLIEYLNAPEVS